MADQIDIVLPILPVPPEPDSSTFDPEMEAFLRALAQYQSKQADWTAQANALAAGVENDASLAEQDAMDAEAAAASAGGAADEATAARDTTLAARDTTLDARDVAIAASATATNAADAASASAASVNPGTDPEQIVRAGDLGTSAWLDQTWLFKSTTWDAPSCANATQVSTTLEVPGVEIGDTVDARASVALSGLHLRGEATAANVVTLYLSNLTGAAIDLPSATYYAAILKRTPTR